MSAAESARVRWSKREIGAVLKAAIEKKAPKGKPEGMCPHGREYGHCIIQICQDAYKLGLGVVKE